MNHVSLNRDRFLKVLSLAESDQDGEALAALRKATAMARASGLSLGEAISQSGEDDFTDIVSRITITADAAEVRALRNRVADLEVRLAQKLSRDDRYATGRWEGYEEGRKDATREFANQDAFKTGYRAGYEAGQESERPSINAAYSRGYADGKAAVALDAAPKKRRRAGRG